VKICRSEQRTEDGGKLLKLKLIQETCIKNNKHTGSTNRIAAETDMSVPFTTTLATSHKLYHYTRYVIGHDPGPLPSPISHPSSSDTIQRYSPPSTLFQHVYLQCVFPSHCSLNPGLAKWPLYCSLLDYSQVIRIYNLICNVFAFFI